MTVSVPRRRRIRKQYRKFRKIPLSEAEIGRDYRIWKDRFLPQFKTEHIAGEDNLQCFKTANPCKCFVDIIYNICHNLDNVFTAENKENAYRKQIRQFCKKNKTTIINDCVQPVPDIFNPDETINFHLCKQHMPKIEICDRNGNVLGNYGGILDDMGMRKLLRTVNRLFWSLHKGKKKLKKYLDDKKEEYENEFETEKHAKESYINDLNTKLNNLENRLESEEHQKILNKNNINDLVTFRKYNFLPQYMSNFGDAYDSAAMRKCELAIKKLERLRDEIDKAEYITPSLRKSLKKLYRDAGVKCHPDKRNTTSEVDKFTERMKNANNLRSVINKLINKKDRLHELEESKLVVVSAPWQETRQTQQAQFNPYQEPVPRTIRIPVLGKKYTQMVKRDSIKPIMPPRPERLKKTKTRPMLQRMARPFRTIAEIEKFRYNFNKLIENPQTRETLQELVNRDLFTEEYINSTFKWLATTDWENDSNLRDTNINNIEKRIENINKQITSKGLELETWFTNNSTKLEEKTLEITNEIQTKINYIENFQDCVAYLSGEKSKNFGDWLIKYATKPTRDRFYRNIKNKSLYNYKAGFIEAARKYAKRAHELCLVRQRDFVDTPESTRHEINSELMQLEHEDAINEREACTADQINNAGIICLPDPLPGDTINCKYIISERGRFMNKPTKTMYIYDKKQDLGGGKHVIEYEGLDVLYSEIITLNKEQLQAECKNIKTQQILVTKTGLFPAVLFAKAYKNVKNPMASKLVTVTEYPQSDDFIPFNQVITPDNIIKTTMLHEFLPKSKAYEKCIKTYGNLIFDNSDAFYIISVYWYLTHVFYNYVLEQFFTELYQIHREGYFFKTLKTEDIYIQVENDKYSFKFMKVNHENYTTKMKSKLSKLSLYEQIQFFMEQELTDYQFLNIFFLGTPTISPSIKSGYKRFLTDIYANAIGIRNGTQVDCSDLGLFGQSELESYTGTLL